MTKAPEFIRVKRRRDEGSVHALLIDEDKRAKRAKYVFKLQKTINENSYENEKESNTPLLKLSNDDGRHFVLEQHKRKRDKPDSDNEIEPQLDKQGDHTDKLPTDIAQMVNDYLKLQPNNDSTRLNTSQRKKPTKKRYLNSVTSLPSQDYVYDIYHLEIVPDTELITYDSDNNVGFVKIVNKYVDLLPDDEEYSDSQIRSDDEDSNDENYYQNDYPEDEDDDRSILFGEEGEGIADDEDEMSKSQQISELQKWGVVPSNVEEWEESKSGDQTVDNTNEYSELFNKYEDSENILYSINKNHVVDVDMDNTRQAYYDEDDNIEINDTIRNSSANNDNDRNFEYERNTFFETDRDDPLAQHRDKIFGELQRKINE
ncbi:similar to Saccharomyces cerevisiae YDL115C IWR1 RNA polymerase II transport factor, conserved from yeast to humans [Maudiozyma saulgeensis]|uniref:Similar to Saccharomyces cerevisiae YDL115C IWR1 RNA polymerase II transport factor, conserved from yeast to humans n=1 Tax=Maudiozyma saulgeensis TaxID=1789683 RepID=A0A1X7QZA7_9SACH|nr:similar to Saccharomyces cerevisiae YDL115C IWR1 RNA polymerase II transport factor, conserved from yeast to humans [Kazachstania saulgeensis]